MENTWQIWVRRIYTSLEEGSDIDSCAGSILFAFIAILVSLVLLWRSDRKKAAVGRRLVAHKRSSVALKRLMSSQGNANIPNRLYRHRDMRDFYRWRLPTPRQCTTRLLSC